MAEKSVQGCQVPVQYLYFIDTSQGLHAQGSGYLVRVRFDTPLGDQITQELPGCHTESALFWVKPDLVLPGAIERLTQVSHVVGGPTSLHEHVIRRVPPWCARSAP